MRWVRPSVLLRCCVRLVTNQPIYIHGALQKLCELYERHGVELGPLRPASAGKAGQTQPELVGQIVIAPPSAFASKWG